MATKIKVQTKSATYEAAGSFAYNDGTPRRKAIVGVDRVHGYTETPQVPFVDGRISDWDTLDPAALGAITDATVTLSLANGQEFVLHNAWYVDNARQDAVRFEGCSASTVP